jgi:hypothetical protein
MLHLLLNYSYKKKHVITTKLIKLVKLMDKNHKLILNMPIYQLNNFKRNFNKLNLTFSVNLTKKQFESEEKKFNNYFILILNKFLITCFHDI